MKPKREQGRQALAEKRTHWNIKRLAGLSLLYVRPTIRRYIFSRNVFEFFVSLVTLQFEFNTMRLTVHRHIVERIMTIRLVLDPATKPQYNELCKPAATKTHNLQLNSALISSSPPVSSFPPPQYFPASLRRCYYYSSFPGSNHIRYIFK